MADLIEGVHPTRMALLNLKRKLSLADKGHRLLKEKRDALMLEFMTTARDAEETADETIRQLSAARDALSTAEDRIGQRELSSISLSTETRPQAELKYKNVMGVGLPKITMPRLEHRPDERDYSIALIHPSVDEAASAYEKAAERVIKLLEVETTLRALSDETRRTKRRVNALEYHILPRIRNTKKYVEMRLDELERESFYRLKVVKSKRG
ncbi:MAG: V-type ATP synthase subunit D [Candidatus Altiarchaeota archaeon]|nr:V-type ATP synthase subunit D [Candidatus Altiarchaeota archaeon]